VYILEGWVFKLITVNHSFHFNLSIGKEEERLLDTQT